MCNVVSPKNFFPEVKGNLTKIVWAHAVNSKAELDRALSSNDIMMLEADVVLGKLNETDNSSIAEIPIMAHPPENLSDLSLEDFLNTTIHKTGIKKGIKLDFKTIQAFEKSKPILTKLRENFKFPVFINADILPGPVNATATPVNAKDFLKGAVETIPECTLSVGWTTRYGKEYNIIEGRYTPEQIKNMTDTLAENQIKQSVTYPIRAGLAANDIETVKALLNNTSSDNVTLTIWSSEGDHVDAAQLSKLIKDVGVEKIYLDVPEDLKKKLDFSSASTLVSAAILIAGMMLALFSINM
ncbi:protein FAM151B isoform X2 [Odontomachus brunneus]|nr:protein FAM151B isoform X2 [Odontomachus brunneus]XP_032665962.1 protein FAM151B isoform X2 [Odontomachus brunneus]